MRQSQKSQQIGHGHRILPTLQQQQQKHQDESFNHNDIPQRQLQQPENLKQLRNETIIKHKFLNNCPFIHNIKEQFDQTKI